MKLHRTVERFSALAAQAPDIADLRANAIEATMAVGFDRLAIVHGLWFRRPGPNLIRIDNFGAWADEYIANHYYMDDPALLACQRTSLPFSWARISELIELTARQRFILSEAQQHGLRTGFTVPVGVLGEPSGCCSFASASDRLPSRWHCRAAGLIGAEAFAAARRLHGFTSRIGKIPQLSPRKLDCLRWLCCGKTDGEIATILGLKESTVRTYMTLLRQDFDVVSRCQLVAEALRFGLVSFDDAIPSS